MISPSTAAEWQLIIKKHLKREDEARWNLRALPRVFVGLEETP